MDCVGVWGVSFVPLDMGFLESCADDVKFVYVVEFLKSTKVFKSKKEYLFCLGVIDKQVKFLRQLVESGYHIERIQIWRAIEELEDRLETLWKTTRYVWLTDTREGAGEKKKKYADLGDKTKWRGISEREAPEMTRDGRMVRTVGEGNQRKWEVAE